MHRRVVADCIALTLLLLAVMTAPAAADLVVLKTGGRISGELQRESSPAAGGDQVSIRTLTGAIITVPRSDVASVTKRRLVFEQYDALKKTAPDTVEGQWELSQWCLEKSLKEREVHLKRIIELDPDHEGAHHGLHHVRYDGQWSTRDEVMTARGYIKHKGKYVLPQELDLIKQEQKETESEKAWYKRVKMWHGWLDSDRVERQTESLSQLQSITDPHAVPALYRTFATEGSEQYRLMYVGILSKIKDDRSLGPLVFQSLRDESEIVRQAAVQGIPRDSQLKTQPVYVKALKNDLNAIVNRAGAALAQVGDEHVVPQLITALVTSHRYRVTVPDQDPSIGVAADGRMAQTNVPVVPPNIALMLATGQLPFGVQVEQVTPGMPVRTKEVTVQRNEENPAVLAALNKITGQNFGFDVRAWRNWYNSTKNGNGKKLPMKGKSKL